MLLAKGKDLRQTPDFFHRSVWICFLKDTACFTGCNIWKVCSKFPIFGAHDLDAAAVVVA